VTARTTSAVSAPQPALDERLRELLDAQNRRDLDEIMDSFADDAVLDMARGPDPWGLRFEGKAAIRVALARRFDALPDLHYEEDRHFGSGDFGCSTWTLTATTRSGQRVELRGCDIYEFRNGKVVHKDTYWKIRG
jgi:ketosteroid isomerase-like protein